MSFASSRVTAVLVLTVVLAGAVSAAAQDDPHAACAVMGWVPQETFESGIRKTVQWYLENRPWWQRVLSGDYRLARLGA